MKFLGSAIAAGAAAGLTLTGAAAAQSFNVSCVKGADERTVEILTPGIVGAACDVRYARFGGTKTPYHANNTSSFCREKADEIVATLITSGFACGQVGGPLTAEARSSSPPETASLAQPEPIEEPAPEPAVRPNEIATENETTPAAIVADEVATPAAPEPAVEPNAVAAPIIEPADLAVGDDIASVEAPAPVAPDVIIGAAPIEEPFSPPAAPEAFETQALDPIVADDGAVDHASTAAPTPIVESETAQLNEPAVRSVATQGPATLARDDLEELQRAAEPIAAGRLIGAAPTLEPAPEVQQATAATQPTPAAIVAAAPAQPSSDRPSGLRDPEEIIVATLNAQVAAWNEGNLQAFMDTYWNDADLKFVSGTAITKGWSPTMKRYRERYADPSGLGQLSFEKTDVEMVTDDVAVVTGRFNHVKNEDASSGVFTLVMKRVSGVWRIVHDHSVNDAS